MTILNRKGFALALPLVALCAFPANAQSSSTIRVTADQLCAGASDPGLCHMELASGSHQLLIGNGISDGLCLPEGQPPHVTYVCPPPSEPGGKCKLRDHLSLADTLLSCGGGGIPPRISPGYPILPTNPIPAGPSFDWVKFAGPTDVYCSSADSDVGNGKVSVENGQIVIDPRSNTVPNLTIPNTVGAEGFSSRDLFDHVYNYYTEVPEALRSIGLSTSDINYALTTIPTPGSPLPASTRGTRNNVGFVPGTDSTNFVRSFVVPSPDASRYTDIVVNYTISGEHGLEEGMVIRYGLIDDDGNVTGIRTYGEGNGWRQNAVLRGSWCTYGSNLWEAVDTDVLNLGLNR